MVYQIKLALLLFIVFGTGTSQAQKLNYNNLRDIIQKNNAKIKSHSLQVDSFDLRRGFLNRSFIPSVHLEVGREELHSESLGAHSSNYYGIKVMANVYRGGADYWENEKRDVQASLARIRMDRSLNQIVLEAQKTFLTLCGIKLSNQVLTSGLRDIDTVSAQVRRKIRSGVITESDWTALKLAKVRIKEDLNQLERLKTTGSANLMSLTAIQDLSLDDIDHNILTQKQASIARKESVNKTTSTLSARVHLARASVKGAEANIHLSKKRPSLDIFVEYGRLPFSEREVSPSPQRQELKAGVRAQWNIGHLKEQTLQSRSAALQAQEQEKLAEYTQAVADDYAQALRRKTSLLLKSISKLESEIGLSQNYFKQVSNEYLRGVKSTSDLISALHQTLYLKKRKIELHVQYRSTLAEIESLYGKG